MVCYLDFTIIITSKILFKHLAEQSFSLNNISYKTKKRSILAEFDIWSKRIFFKKKSWKRYFAEAEYTKWTKDLPEIEYSFESIHWSQNSSRLLILGEFKKKSQNSVKNNKIFWSVNYKKFWFSICSIVFVL